MKIDKDYKMSRLLVLSALIVTISGLSVITTTTSVNNAIAGPEFSVEGMGCLIYQSYPALGDCAVPMSHKSFLEV